MITEHNITLSDNIIYIHADNTTKNSLPEGFFGSMGVGTLVLSSRRGYQNNATAVEPSSHGQHQNNVKMIG